MRPIQFAALAVALVSLLGLSVSIVDAQNRRGGTLRGKVTLRDADGDRVDPSNVAVYLEGTATQAPENAGAPQRITQQGLRFEPALAVVMTGSAVEFPNNDNVFHNVFSLSRTRRFDLGLYRSGATKAVTFNRPGVVDVYCNIHPDMSAHVLVLDTLHYDVADRDGSFEIRGIPEGTYEVVGWQRYGEPFRGRVTVRSSSTARLDIPLTAAEAPRRHTRKDGTPYGRYR